jgi:hypothetical protein
MPPLFSKCSNGACDPVWCYGKRLRTSWHLGCGDIVCTRDDIGEKPIRNRYRAMTQAFSRWSRSEGELPRSSKLLDRKGTNRCVVEKQTPGFGWLGSLHALVKDPRSHRLRRQHPRPHSPRQRHLPRPKARRGRSELAFCTRCPEPWLSARLLSRTWP